MGAGALMTAGGSKGGAPPSSLEGARVIMVTGELGMMGGSQRQALLLAEYLVRERGARVEYWGVAGDPGRVAAACDDLGIPWRVCDAPWFAKPAAKALGLSRLARSLRRERPDIIFPQLIVPNVACGLVWRWTGARACIWNQRDIQGRVGPRAERAAVRRTSWFVCNSEEGARFLTDTLGAPRERVSVIHNGIRLAPPQSGRAEWRERLGLAGDELAACMVGNLTLLKDHETLLKAWRLVVERAERAGRAPVLLLAGSLDSSDNTRDASKALAYDLGLGRSVRFIGQVKDVSGLLGAADFGVFSSRFESSPNGVLECMAAGLAVAGTDIPGVREAVGPQGYELLAPPGDVEALAERVLRLVADASLRARAGEANRLRVETEFSPRLMCERTASLMEGFMRGTRPGSPDV
jgi:glycosyltransferase involved in cell wall biosynthesis